jgi:hypothetical protein
MKARNVITGVILIGLLISLMSCASIISGSSQKIDITTDPSEAQIKIYNSSNMEVWNSKSPSTVTLKRGDGFFQGANYRIEIEKEGYEPSTIALTSSLNGGWYLAGNILLGGLIGWLIVDPLTGGMWTLHPKDINTTLNPTETASIFEQEDGLMIVLREEIADDTFDHLHPKRIY